MHFLRLAAKKLHYNAVFDPKIPLYVNLSGDLIIRATSQNNHDPSKLVTTHPTSC
jgi:hypothetical protein